MSVNKGCIRKSLYIFILIVILCYIVLYYVFNRHHLHQEIPTETVESINISCKKDNCFPTGENFSCNAKECSYKPRKLPSYDSKRFVIHGVDSQNFFYLWFAPITSILWSQVMKWTPIFFILHESNKTADPIVDMLIEYIRASGAMVHSFPNPVNPNEYLFGMVCGLLRLYCTGYEFFEPDDYLMISDLDMWPLNSDFFNENTQNGKGIDILNAYYFGDPVTAPEYPICYCGMNVSIWREVMEINKGDDPFEYIKYTIENQQETLEPKKQWGVDQVKLARQIQNWKHFPEEVNFLKRDMNSDRIDRSNFKKWEDYTNPVESHTLRPGFSQQNWPRVRELLTHVLKDDQMDWVDDYALTFCHLLACYDISVEESMVPIFHPGGA